MPDTRHLHALPAVQPSPPERARLTAWQRKEVEGVRQLVMETGDMLTDGRPAAYVAGLLEGAAANLLDILDAVCEVD